MKIKNRWTQEVIIEDKSENIRDCVINAIKKRANLSGANLSRTSGLGFKPIQIQGSRHWVIRTSKVAIAIGCHEYLVTDWLKNYKKIGQKEGYSESEIYEYGEYIKLINRLIAKEKEQINE